MLISSSTCDFTLYPDAGEKPARELAFAMGWAIDMAGWMSKLEEACGLITVETDYGTRAGSEMERNVISSKGAAHSEQGVSSSPSRVAVARTASSVPLLLHI